MKALFVASSLLLLVLATSPECSAQDEPQLLVIRYSWSRYVSALEEEPEFRTGKPTRDQQIYDRERQTIERGYGDLIRSKELREVERNATRSSSKPIEWFTYKVKVRNTNAKTIKNIFWEYQIIDPANPNNPTRRQFFCAQKIRPQGNANLAVLSPAMPRARTISATAGRNAKAAFEEKAVINRIEYADNSVWQRAGWDFPNPAAAALPSYKRAAGGPACTSF